MLVMKGIAIGLCMCKYSIYLSPKNFKVDYGSSTNKVRSASFNLLPHSSISITKFILFVAL